MALRWSVRPKDAWGDLAAAYVDAIRRGVKAIADQNSVLIEAWMKENAPWQDQTGNSRQTLHSEVEQLTLDMVEIQMAHGQTVPGIYLELANSGVYSVLSPALDHWGPIVWRDVQQLLR